jgi:hypothetical protein
MFEYCLRSPSSGLKTRSFMGVSIRIVSMLAFFHSPIAQSFAKCLRPQVFADPVTTKE